MRCENCYTDDENKYYYDTPNGKLCHKCLEKEMEEQMLFIRNYVLDNSKERIIGTAKEINGHNIDLAIALFDKLDGNIDTIVDEVAEDNDWEIITE